MQSKRAKETELQEKLEEKTKAGKLKVFLKDSVVMPLLILFRTKLEKQIAECFAIALLLKREIFLWQREHKFGFFGFAEFRYMWTTILFKSSWDTVVLEHHWTCFNDVQ